MRDEVSRAVADGQAERRARASARAHARGKGERGHAGRREAAATHRAHTERPIEIGAARAGREERRCLGLGRAATEEGERAHRCGWLGRRRSRRQSGAAKQGGRRVGAPTY